MICNYFKEDHAIYCSAKVFPHVPSIGEMELFCLKNFYVCPIFNEMKDNCVPNTGEIIRGPD